MYFKKFIKSRTVQGCSWSALHDSQKSKHPVLRERLRRHIRLIELT
nr:hypothetical protein [Tanacetum cinerariifolium]